MADTYEPFGQGVPFSLEAEQSVIGSAIIDPRSMDVINEILRPDFFYLPQHQAIYTTLTDMSLVGAAVDPVTLLEKLKSDGVYDDAGGKAYITQLVESVPSAANVASYANIVRDKYFLRSLLNVAKETIENVEQNVSDVSTIIDLTEQKIFDIRQGRDVSGLVSLKEVIHNETLYRIDRLNDPETRNDYIGIPTGFGDLDKITSGLNKSDLIIVGARPGMGKTAFCLNIARHVAVKEQKTVCVFSLEMSRDQLAQRLISSDACIPSERLRTGKLEGKEWTNLVQATEQLSKAKMYVDETSDITVPQMKAKLRRLGHVDLVIIDYLQLMKGSRHTENRVQEVSEITRNLKIMAKELGVPVIVCSQLARGNEATEKVHRPNMASLRESGSIEQDADIVLLLYRDGYYNSNNDNPEDNVNEHDATCIVAKNRHGSTGDIDLYWDGQFTRFTSVSHGNER